MKLKALYFIFLCLFVVPVFGQQRLTQNKILVPKPYEKIKIDSNSIQVHGFKLLDKNQNAIDSSHYDINFNTAELAFKYPVTDTVYLSYKKYPSFLTKTYSYYNSDRVVPDGSGSQRMQLYEKPANNFKPFDGLTTMGSITRGVTVGNNQNAVTTSTLDLQITGKLSDKVSIRASLQDSSIPIQDGGYSQKIDEFDQIFIELFADKWNIRAGDLFLNNQNTRFLNFNKKVQGLHIGFGFGDDQAETKVELSGAFVRGNYAKSQFTGQEGNQGPYKLRGNNNELYVLVISGSESVYVNGLLLKRGEENDYVIDYNAGEIRFTPKFPITSEMRIVVEYQFSDRNYSRFVTYNSIQHTKQNWNVAAYVYSENDIKNQPLQQNLSAEQVEVLKQAGNDTSKMQAPSAYVDSYSENKILYKKIIVSGSEAFEYSNDNSIELYQVKFTYVGANKGSYKLLSNQAIGKIYEYVGNNLGDYNPTTQLIAPIKLQIATIVGQYTPSEKTNLDVEIAVSNNDKNLFSTIDDEQNKGTAIKLNGKQTLFKRKNTLDAFTNFNYIERNFKTVERLYNIEFNRDWNIDEIILENNQKLTTVGLNYVIPNQGNILYQFDQLNLSGNFNGYKQSVQAVFQTQKIEVSQNFSYLSTQGNTTKSKFLRNYSKGRYLFDKNWIGAFFNTENNQQKHTSNDSLTGISQRFAEIGSFIGRGKLDGIFGELGYTFRTNDSIQAGKLTKVNQSHSVYINSRVLQTELSDLSIYINYRTLKYSKNNEKEPSLNSRIVYNDQFFKQLIQWGTAYETSSGSIAQQEFTYLEVEAGQGAYMWIDYNGNGIQELEEFELAPYPDLAKYVRVFLPNQVFLRTHQNRISQTVSVNFNKYLNANNTFLKTLSHFHNQTAIIIDQKTFKTNNDLQLNPFNWDESRLASLATNFRNSFFYNRGKQNHSVTYTFQDGKIQNLLVVGSQRSKNAMHQLQYTHLLKKLWLFEMQGQSVIQKNESENYASKNYYIKGYTIGPTIGYLFNANASINLGYQLKDASNKWNGLEELKQSKLFLTFNFASQQKYTINGSLNYLVNTFTGNSYTAAGFNLLESLQPGKNVTWTLLLQRNLTSYLDLNLNYNGRKSESTQTIHTGSVQLRAFF